MIAFEGRTAGGSEVGEAPSTSKGNGRVTDKFDAYSDPHLDDLLKRADLNLTDGTPVGVRTAAMYILDYYQAILQEAAAKVGVNLEGASIPIRISRVRSSIGGLQIDHLEGLDDVRASVYHHENRLPNPKALRKYLDEARPTREGLKKAVETAIAKEGVMARSKQRLKASGEELLRLIPSVYSEKAKQTWKEKAERAIQSGSDKSGVFDESDLELLLQVRDQIVTIRISEEMLGLNEPPPETDQPEEFWPEEPEHPEPVFDPGDFYPEDPPPGEPPDYSPDDSPPEDDQSEEEQPEDDRLTDEESPDDEQSEDEQK